MPPCERADCRGRGDVRPVDVEDIRTLACERRDDALELVRALSRGRGGQHRDPFLRGQRLQAFETELRGLVGGIPQNGESRQPGDEFPRELNDLGVQVRRLVAEPGDGATGPRETLHQSRLDGTPQTQQDDGQRLRPLLELERRRGLCRHHQLHIRLEELTDELRVALFAAVRESKLDYQVPALDIAVLAQTVSECREKERGARRGREVSEVTDPMDLSRRLRLGGERRGEEHRTRACQERAPLHHWMSSSARSRSDCGIVRPSALAVLRLITSSKLVGCSTGRSAGLAPLRILSTMSARRPKTSRRSEPYDMRPPDSTKPRCS